MKRCISYTALVLLAIGASVAVSTPASAATSGCLSDRGNHFDVTSNQGLRLDGFGSPRILYNGTSSPATLSFTQSSTGTSQWQVNGSVSGTAGFDFLAIKGGVTATVGGSYTSSNAVNQTTTVNITVPVNQYGILQGGVFRRITQGHYFYDYGNCTYSAGSWPTTKLPVTADGFATATNSSGNVPWDRN